MLADTVKSIKIWRSKAEVNLGIKKIRSQQFREASSMAIMCNFGSEANGAIEAIEAIEAIGAANTCAWWPMVHTT
jgi:hypothetical protein